MCESVVALRGTLKRIFGEQSFHEGEKFRFITLSTHTHEILRRNRYDFKRKSVGPYRWMIQNHQSPVLQISRKHNGAMNINITITQHTE